LAFFLAGFFFWALLFLCGLLFWLSYFAFLFWGWCFFEFFLLLSFGFLISSYRKRLDVFAFMYEVQLKA
jgi:hypothetical protein